MFYRNTALLYILQKYRNCFLNTFILINYNILEQKIYKDLVKKKVYLPPKKLNSYRIAVIKVKYALIDIWNMPRVTQHCIESIYVQNVKKFKRR